MRPDTAPRHTAIRLADYTPPVWQVESVALTFRLDPAATRVTSEIVFALNPDRAASDAKDLVLHGENLTLIEASIDGKPLTPAQYTTDDKGLSVPGGALPDRFTWRGEVEIAPEDNKALEGLYISNGMYCTQCEAEGFRKITYFPDRPDVMTTYTVRVEADRGACPVLLSNGERGETGDLPDGWHYAVWHDPHPKPAYLFALVAGQLEKIEDSFTTASGMDVALEIYVRPGDEDKCDYAMDSLKRSMKWDEEAYGREYDLPLFMIVAVDDFNMGAMENKGLNIFNTRLVLASPETATDGNYLGIESVVAHEYFHNWTGNRITCRDWFQLCLKEGLTVFRDQQFSEEMRSADVMRIGEVAALRARQFREDAGPLAHPVRPEEYIEINNFYTATVYEKGAEVVRMLHTLVGPQTYRKALDLYFERHDGEACTIEDFRQCFEDASGRDLTQFARWWSQAGTPIVSAILGRDDDSTALDLVLAQSLPAAQGGDTVAPMHIPVAVGFLGEDGAELELEGPDGARRRTHIVELTERSQTFTFHGAPPPTEMTRLPLLSALRGFSAPVILNTVHGTDEFVQILAHDSDAFNRSEAGRALALSTLLTRDAVMGTDMGAVDDLSAALHAALKRGGDPALLALLLRLPGEDEIAAEFALMQQGVDPDRIHTAREEQRHAIAVETRDTLIAAYEKNAVPGPYSPDATSAGKRALRNAALSLLATLGQDGPAPAMATSQFASADNMTDSTAALMTLMELGGPAAQAALDSFHARWKKDPLVLDMWVGIQVALPHAEALDRAKALRARDDIDWRNPNRFRSLIGAFASNHWRFHAADGAGYDFFAEQIAWLDGVNPQTAARMATVFQTWRRYDNDRQEKMQSAMRRILDRSDCSRDTYEIVSRLLG